MSLGETGRLETILTHRHFRRPSVETRGELGQLRIEPTTASRQSLDAPDRRRRGRGGVIPRDGVAPACARGPSRSQREIGVDINETRRDRELGGRGR